MIHTAAVLTAVGVYREAAARPPASIVVRRGDSLSGIAARYHIEWPVAPASPASATTDPVAAHAISAGPAAPAGSFQQCVISRESGGNAQVMNGSGHYGLYQFSYSAWTAAGGNAADFGHASAAEQNQVFATAYAQDGTSPWAPYDGC